MTITLSNPDTGATEAVEFPDALIESLAGVSPVEWARDALAANIEAKWQAVDAQAANEAKRVNDIRAFVQSALAKGDPEVTAIVKSVAVVLK